MRNPAYSLRAFARDLGVGSTSLSDFLASKRRLSKTSLARISEVLAWSPEECKQALIENKKGRVEQPQEERLQLAEDEFRLIADWFYLAVLSLAEIKGNKAGTL